MLWVLPCASSETPRAVVTSAPEVRKQGCRAHLTDKDTADHNSWDASLKSHREHTGDTTGETHTWSSPPTFGFSGKYHQRLIINSTDYSPGGKSYERKGPRRGATCPFASSLWGWLLLLPEMLLFPLLPSASHPLVSPTAASESTAHLPGLGVSPSRPFLCVSPLSWPPRALALQELSAWVQRKGHLRPLLCHDRTAMPEHVLRARAKLKTGEWWAWRAGHRGGSRLQAERL